jgi:alpha-tubulin suppressor-like RCC1 family protein
LSNGGVVVSRASAVVSWLSDDGGLPASFEVQLSEDGNVWGAVKIASATSYSFTDLLPGKNYWVRVRGVNDVGSSVSFVTLSFKTISLDLPQSLRITGRGVGSVSLAWDKPAQDPDLVDDYQILYSLDGSVWNTFIDGVSTQTTAMVTGLETAKTYYFKIAAGASGQLSAEIGVKSLPPNTYGLVTAGGSHMCAILDAVLTCWGSNRDGQLSALPSSERGLSVQVALDNAVQVEAGGSHTCALVVTKEVFCWGLNTSGQLGNGSSISSWIPVKVIGISNAVSLSLGNSHSCASLSDKTVKCWGMNSDGRLGDGTLISRNYPVVARNQSDVKDIVAGYYHTCSLRYTGVVNCWGSNLAGQTAGAKLSSLGVATQIATQGDFSCALLIDKTVWCWGWNNARQIVGNGPNIISSPTRLLWADGALSLDVGNDHICIVTSESTIKCVGWNNVGQLGDGTNLNRTVPITVLQVTAATRVFMGGGGWGADFTCAVVRGQKVYCWGDNSSGQVSASDPSEHLSSPTAIQHLWIGVNAKSAEVPRTGSLLLSATATTLQARIEIQDNGGITTQCLFTLTSTGLKPISSKWLEVSDFTFVGLKEKTVYKVQAQCRNDVGKSSSSPIASKKTGALAIMPTVKLPTIVGKSTKGSKLSLKLGSYLEGVSISFEWKINGVVQKNGSGSTFVVPAGIKGKKITVTVIAKKKDYKDLAITSKPIQVTS